MEGFDYWKDRRWNDERKDWRDNDPWVVGYWNSRSHPHRPLIIEAIEKLGKVKSVYEVGCNCGPNLSLIKEKFGAKVGGIDANEDSVLWAKTEIDGDFSVGSLVSLPQKDDSYDVVVADAVLMYVRPDEISLALSEMDRVAQKGIVICDWFDESKLGTEKSHHWARNYPTLFEDLGYKVEWGHKILPKEWPSKNWQEHGYVWSFRRA